MKRSATARNIKFFTIFNDRTQYRSWNISNDSLWLHMIKTDISVCVLIYSGVNKDLQGQKLVKVKPKVANFAPKS